MKPVSIPSLGVAMSEALLVGWLKAPGDRVEKGEPIAEIETDKATVQLESPVAGRMGQLLFEVGAIVPINQTITTILEAGDPGEDEASAPAAAAKSAPTSAVRKAAPNAAKAAVGAATASASASTVTPASIPTVPPPALSPAGNPTIDLDGLPADDLPEWLATMLLIREFEGRLDALSMSGRIPGGVHLSIGQEAVAVGAIRALHPNDLIAGGHRSHHHAIAKGLTARVMMAELYGRATGCCGGRGGTMHLADFALGYLGGNGIVGASVGIAMGAALAAQVRGVDQVAMAFVGDGAANTGRTWENVNLAAIWKLPLIVVCENNGYAVETAIERVTAGGSVAARASGFGLPALVVDGQDVGAMYRAVATARERAAAGDGPTFIEAMTYRYEGHSTGQVITYRTVEELRDWQTTRDPIDRLRTALVGADLLSETDLVNLVARLGGVVDDAIEFAEASPLPLLSDTRASVLGVRGHAR